MTAALATSSLTRACPLCAGTQGNPLHAQLFAAFDGEDPTGYTLVTCAACGFGFADLASSQSASDVTYRDTSVPTERAVDLQRLERTARFLSERLPASARILDAGCGTGALLEYLQSRGLRASVGLDGSRSAAESGRARGRDVRIGSLVDPPADLGTFDVIVLAHVLEHIVDLHAVVRAIRTLLRPGGLVYAETPDAGRYDKFCYEPFHDVNSEHVNHFSPAALDALFASHGFVCEELRADLIECAPGIPYPVALGLWRDAGSAPAAAIPYDGELSAALDRYVAGSLALLGTVAGRIATDLAGHEAFALWGAGEFVRRIASDTRFAGARLEAVVDGAELLQGRRFGGVRIGRPESLATRPDLPILVGSVLHREAIEGAIAGRGWHNPVIRLYRPEIALV